MGPVPNFRWSISATQKINLIRNYELLSRNYDLVIRNYKLLSRNYNLLIRNYELNLFLYEWPVQICIEKAPLFVNL